jgi:tetratricopeptide (TPR) repeat protein
MLRLIGFFLLVIVTMQVLTILPVVGPLMQSLGFFGFWFVAMFVGWYLNALGAGLLAKRKFSASVRELGNVDTPRNQGKLGVLLLESGKPRAAIEPLLVAYRAQPESQEWRYGLGRAYLAVSSYDDSAEHFQAVATLDASYGYGRVLLGLAEARIGTATETNQKGADIALQALDRHDQDRGANPESALLRGLAFKHLGRKDEARAAFETVGGLARNLPPAYRRRAFPYQVRAFFARFG